MYRNFLTMAALVAAGSAAQASAQYPTAQPAPVAAPYTAPTQQVAVTPAAGRPVGPLPAGIPYAPLAAPQSVIPGHAGAPAMVTQPRAVPPTAGTITAISPQPTYAATTTPAPVPAYPVTSIMNQPYQTIPQYNQTYTPTYYYYYYQRPYQAAVAAPVQLVPVQPVAMNAFYGAYDGSSGPMYNARGERGHVRWPYYSYRRPWYWAGQPSFNVTIPGPVW